MDAIFRSAADLDTLNAQLSQLPNATLEDDLLAAKTGNEAVSRRALALAVTIQVSRYILSSFNSLAAQFWLSNFS